MLVSYSTWRPLSGFLFVILCCGAPFCQAHVDSHFPYQLGLDPATERQLQQLQHQSRHGQRLALTEQRHRREAELQVCTYFCVYFLNWFGYFD